MGKFLKIGFFLLYLSFFHLSCVVIDSSVPKLEHLVVSDTSRALIGISSNYKMRSMANSRDVIFFLKEIHTGKILYPNYKDDESTTLFFDVEAGVYRVSYVLIKDGSMVLKKIFFDDSTKTITKSISLLGTKTITKNKKVGVNSQ